MKVSITFEVDDDERRAIARFYGEPGKASYKDVKIHIQNMVNAELEAINHLSEPAVKSKADEV
jgi:hypothetical protein